MIDIANNETIEVTQNQVSYNSDKNMRVFYKKTFIKN